MRPYEEYREDSTPPSRRRKYYSIDHTLSINIDIGPFLLFYDVKLLSASDLNQLPKEMKADIAKIEHIKEKPEQFSQLYQKWILLEKQNQEIVQQKHVLLAQRHYIQERVKNLLNALFTDPQEIEIAYRIFARKYSNIDALARELDIHPKSIQRVLDLLKKEINYNFMN
jgi:predicted transcriptional regulator